MSDSISIGRNELASIRRELSALRQHFQIADLVNRKQAIEITGESPARFSNKVHQGYYKVICNNGGRQYFSRKQLTGFE